MRYINLRLTYLLTLKGTAHSPTPCRSCPQCYWLACQQTTLQEWHTEGEQIISDLQVFTPDALPVATLAINLGTRVY